MIQRFFGEPGALRRSAPVMVIGARLL